MIALALLITAAVAASGPGKPPISLQTQRSGGPVDPEQAKLRFDRADLAIEVFPERERLSGVATLTFTARAPLTVLAIDLDTNLAIGGIAVDGVPLSRGQWRNPEGRLTITLPAPVAAGTSVTARIAYAGTPHVAARAPWDDGMVWSRTPAGAPWIASTSEGYGCDILWPCLDFPTGEPARVDLHITVPKGLKAPANGVLTGIDTLADGRTTWNWSAKHLNTYAIALNIAPYEELTAVYQSRFGNSFPMSYWYLPGEAARAKALFAEFAPTLDFYEALVGPYPFGDEKMAVVETPYLVMEHQTINAYGNAYKKAPEGFDWLFQHEFGHEWFGNQMTAADWDDYWLHEGFETYMQPLYGQWREGDARYLAMLMEMRPKILARRPIVSGRSRTEEEVYEVDKGGPSVDIYYKGAWVLHTLRGLIGDRAFFAATRRLVYGRDDPRPGNFTPRFGSTAEFRRLVDTAAGGDFGWFFDVYLNDAALPDLVETRDAGTLTLTWKTGRAAPFPLPVEVEVDGVVRRLAMTGGTGRLAVPATAHVVIDPMARVLRRSPTVEAMQATRNS